MKAILHAALTAALLLGAQGGLAQQRATGVVVESADGIAGQFIVNGTGTAVHADVRGTRYGEAVVGISPTGIGVGLRGVSNGGTSLALLAQGPALFEHTIVLRPLTTLPPPVLGGMAMHLSYGLILSDGVAWYRPNVAFVRIEP